MKPTPFLLLALFLPALMTLGGCLPMDRQFEPFTSPANPSADQPPAPMLHEPTEVRIEELPSNKTKESSSDAIVLKWLVPAEHLDGYVIRYGFSANDLEYEERLNWSAIVTEEDSARGKLFVHSLQGIPRDLTVYISIAGVKDDQISKPTNIFSISPTNR